MFLAQAQGYGDKVLYRFSRDGQWRSLSWKEALVQVREIALGLVSLGIDRGDRVAIFARVFCCSGGTFLTSYTLGFCLRRNCRTRMYNKKILTITTELLTRVGRILPNTRVHCLFKK